MRKWILMGLVSALAVACGDSRSPDEEVPVEEVPIEEVPIEEVPIGEEPIEEVPIKVPEEWKDATEWGEVSSEAQPEEFTVSVPFQLRVRPRSNRPLVSDWDIGSANRSWELGIDELQRPYLVLSTDGRDYRTFRAHRSVPLNEVVVVGAHFRGGSTVQFFINGEEINAYTKSIPEAINQPSASVTVGARTGDPRLFIDAEIGAPSILPRLGGIDEMVDQIGVSPVAPLAQRRFIKPPVGYTWFGYYDKQQIDSTGNLMLALRGEPGTENKSPQPRDQREVGYFDLRDDSWHVIAQTFAWNWQQGSMLQWRPGHPDEVIWNDREDSPTPRFVTRLHNLITGETRTLPRPIYHISADGLLAVGTDFGRIEDTRRGYGYAGIPDPHKDVLAPEESTIYTMNLDTGEVNDIANLKEISEVESSGYSGEGKKHYFNCLQFNPSGNRLMFMHRWLDGGFRTRVFSIGIDGSDLKLVSAARNLSHYVWTDDETLVIYSATYGGYTTFKEDGSHTPLLGFGRDGHQSFLRGDQSHIMVSDTYVFDGYQTLFQYDPEFDSARVLQVFEAGPAFVGEFRVDLHPRVTNDGRLIVDTSSLGARQQAIITLP